MSTHGLKSSKLHPYQRSVFPFWRRPENVLLYSDEVKEMFELKKLEFEANAKYLQWTVK